MVYLGSMTNFDGTYNWIQDKCVPLVREITFENGEMVEAEATDPDLSTHIITIIDNQTISYSKYDAISGTAQAGDDPLIFEPGNAPSTYIEDNSINISNNSNGDSGQVSSQTGLPVTPGEQRALDRAHDYLDYMAFSYSGLIEQLEFEGFSHDEAVYAVDNCGADWYEQAARRAREYLNYTSFSYSGLVDQLVFEGFTQEQAEYGANREY